MLLHQFFSNYGEEKVSYVNLLVKRVVKGNVSREGGEQHFKKAISLIIKEEANNNKNYLEDQSPIKIFGCYQEPIMGSLYLPYLVLELTLSRVDPSIECLPGEVSHSYS